MRKLIVFLKLLSCVLFSSEYITNPSRSDGFGAQFQTIIYSAVFAELNNFEFRYTPFQKMEHNYENDPDFLKKKETLVNLINHFPINRDLQKQHHISPRGYIDFVEANLAPFEKSKTLKKIKQIFRENKVKSNYFDDGHFHIAIHIRRPNSHDSRIEGATTPFSTFNLIIETLRNKHRLQSPLFHIYSQGDLHNFKENIEGSDIIYHINESIEDTFSSMALADALVMSESSFSYSAALVSDGDIYYIPFWHPPLPTWTICEPEKEFFAKHLPLDSFGKIIIDPKIKHIKLDIGLSWCAPMSQSWLKNQKDLLVIGFEPNPAAVQSILEGATIPNTWAINHITPSDPLRKQSIIFNLLGSRFFLIPCALGLSQKSSVDFFITSNDVGCSSLFTPKYLPLKEVIKVPIFSLETFFKRFPFDTHPIIDYIKIDAQGSDLEIVKSGGKYLQNVVCITLEPEDYHYEGTDNSIEAIESFMKSIGFTRYHSKNTEDPTYVNEKYLDYFLSHDELYIFQQG